MSKNTQVPVNFTFVEDDVQISAIWLSIQDKCTVKENHWNCEFNMYKSAHTEAYECEVCKNRFLRPRTLVKHKKSHSELSKTRCILPKPLTPSEKESMNETAAFEPTLLYVPIKSKEKLYECDICEKKFPSSAAYGGHKKVHYRKYWCNVCHKAFSKSSDFVGHKRSHPVISRVRKILPKPVNASEKPTKPPEGVVAKTRFLKSKELLQANFLSVDHGENTLDPLDNRQSCNQMDNARTKMRYILPKQCIVSQRIASKPVEQSISAKSTIPTSNSAVDYQSTDKTYQCDVCMAKFSQLAALSVHEKIHPIFFECDVCKKSFLLLSSLEVHKLEHAVEPYECGVCKKTFKTSKTLQRHKERGSACKPYGCNICTSKFLNIESHKFHLLGYHKDKAILCKTCGRELSRSQNSLVNVDVPLKFAHPISDKRGNVSYQCSFCQEIESSDDTWSVCSLCGDCCGNFKELQDHMFTHENDVEKVG